MRRSQRGLVSACAALAAAVAVAGCGDTTTVTETTTVTVPAERSETGLGAPRESLVFGHIGSLTRAGAHYELDFDPAWFLTGEAANRAAAEDGAVEPGEPVPNDNYVVDESHRLLHYRVADDARVTVLTRRGDPAQIGTTPVSLGELAKIMDGTSTVDLFEPLSSGVWIKVDADTVRELRQQYRP